MKFCVQAQQWDSHNIKTGAVLISIDYCKNLLLMAVITRASSGWVHSSTEKELMMCISKVFIWQDKCRHPSPQRGFFPHRCPLVTPGKILGLLNQCLQDCLQDWHQGQVSTRLLHCVDSISIIYVAVIGLSAVAVCVWLTGGIPSHVACLPLGNQCIWFF